MQVLVTGGAGFIGFHVAKALLERGEEVVIVDNFSDYYDVSLKENRIKQIKDNQSLKIYRADISNYEEMEKIFKENKIDKICHLAAQAGVRYSLENPFAYQKTNVLGTLVLLELARHYGIKDFVFASSSSVYGKNKKIPFSESDFVDIPISLYASTKKSNELMAHTYHHLFGLNCTGLRFFTVYGPWGRPDMALFKFVKNTLEGKPIDVYNYGKCKRDFTYVTDIVAGVIAALDNPLPYEIINLGNNVPVELGYFIEIIEKELGKKAIKNMMPLQPGDVPETFADIEKAKKLLGFEPKTKIEEGIKQFIEWYKSYKK
ncbi:NAD-dependent epimerase [Candidatus Woesearchaeota archaeon]|nr:NAD-dependent epimerase [Candidatus Woesearchaeota archaeon]